MEGYHPICDLPITRANISFKLQSLDNIWWDISFITDNLQGVFLRRPIVDDDMDPNEDEEVNVHRLERFSRYPLHYPRDGNYITDIYLNAFCNYVFVAFVLQYGCTRLRGLTMGHQLVEQRLFDRAASCLSHFTLQYEWSSSQHSGLLQDYLDDCFLFSRRVSCSILYITSL